ncbi:MAG: hypothetical protein H0V38_04795 [Sporichthyaceae bacterium]|nr:hypothetical protein [Sporichthyaceae bacterium]
MLPQTGGDTPSTPRRRLRDLGEVGGAARALRRRRSARSLMGDGVPQPEAGRAASRLHLQEAGYALLAVALIFAIAGVLATRD